MVRQLAQHGGQSSEATSTSSTIHYSLYERRNVKPCTQFTSALTVHNHHMDCEQKCVKRRTYTKYYQKTENRSQITKNVKQPAVYAKD